MAYNTTISLISLALLILFSELAATSFKRISPVVRNWSDEQRAEKLMLLFWCIGVSAPLLAFTFAAKIFLVEQTTIASNFVVGAMVGTNIISLSVVFSLILMSGPLAFFRLRTMGSPIFLLFATLIYIFTTLDSHISRAEGFLLLFCALAYLLYFRSFSSEWKYSQLTAREVVIDERDTMITFINVICMSFGFLGLAVLCAFPFVRWVEGFSETVQMSSVDTSIHFIALVLSMLWVIRFLFTLRSSDSSKAMSLTSLTHACLLNILFLPGIIAIFWPLYINGKIISRDLPVLLFFTIVFAATLLIEKKRSRWLPVIILVLYFAYLGNGVIR